MIKKTVIIFFSIFLISCTPKVDIVEGDFKKCIVIVNEFDQYKGAYNDTIKAKVCFALQYLQRISNINGCYIECEHIPIYLSRHDCLSDIDKWEKWYKLNRLIITKAKSDSLKKVIASENIGWSDSTILNYVFATKGSQYLY
jgi:hypothetical protein